MKALSPPNSEIIEKLCLKCGLCCNGALFKDVELQAEDDAKRLKELGLRLRLRKSASTKTPGRSRLIQPCAALGKDCRCSAYENRPGHCREFECLLFGEALDGRIKLASAQAIVRKARALISGIESLFSRLGEDSISKTIHWRFQRVAKFMESGEATEEDRAYYGDLTIAYHRFSHLLGARFYREESGVTGKTGGLDT